MWPPPRKGGMASSSSSRPHSTPMPDGPHILWAEKAMKSAPMACTSVGTWGTNWQASTTATAPWSWAWSLRKRTGLMVPRTFDIAVKQNALVPSSNRSRSVRSSRPSGVSGSQRISKPFSAASICQGTMLAWCSIWVSSTASPSPRFAPPHDRATRFMRLGGVLGEDEAALGRSVDEALHLQPGRLEGLGGVGGQLVRAAVGGGVRRLVEPLHGLEHLAGLLARRRPSRGTRCAGR